MEIHTILYEQQILRRIIIAITVGTSFNYQYILVTDLIYMKDWHSSRDIDSRVDENNHKNK